MNNEFDNVWDKIYGQIHPIWDYVGAHAWKQVGSRIYISVWGQVRDQFCTPVLDEIEDQTNE